MEIAKKTPKNYLFVDNIRFLSMAGVVLLHCGSSIESHTINSAQYPALLVLRQLTSEFSVLCFFLISGFLLADGFSKYSSTQSVVRRIRTTFLPWLFWYFLYSVLLVGSDLIHGTFAAKKVSPLAYLSTIADQAMFHSLYWFVPILIVGIFILTVFYRFRNSLVFGLILFVCSLFYGASMYTGWIPTSNYSSALLSFVFFQWLGLWVAEHYDSFQAWFTRIPTGLLIGITTIFFFVACEEGFLLVARNASTDPLNHLRISNQLFSIACALLLMKIQRNLSPQWMKARSTTYGIYLTHGIMLYLLNFVMRRIFVWNWQDRLITSFPAVLLGTVVLFCLIYGSAWALSMFLVKSRRLQWMVGISPRPVQ